MTGRSVEVPFLDVGGQRALTDEQLAEDPQLWDFVERFAHCFERDDLLHCYYFRPE